MVGFYLFGKAWSSSTSALGHVATSTIQRSCAACPAALSRVRRNAQRVREGWKSKSAFAQLISTTWPSKGETGNWPIGQLSYWASWAMGRNEGNQRPEKTGWTKKIRCKDVSGNSLSSEPVDLVRQVAVLKLWINWWPWLDSKRWRHILSWVDMCMLSKSIWNHRFHFASVGYFFCWWNIVHVNGQATAVALYKSALQFQKMSAETRKANSMALTLVKHHF